MATKNTMQTPMQTREDRLLAHKRQIDAERRAQAILRAQAQRRVNLTAILAVANAPKPADPKEA